MKKPNSHLILRQIYQDVAKRKQKKFISKNTSNKYQTFNLPIALDINNKRLRNSTLKAINSLNDSKSVARSYFDFSNVDTLTPMATIHFAHTLEKNSNLICRGKTSKSHVVSGMLTKLNIYNRLKIKNVESTHDLVDRWYTFTGENADFGDEYDPIEEVLKEKFGEDSETFDVINTAICEAVINVVNHAYEIDEEYKKWKLFLSIKPDRCYVVISDLGKTIPKSIPTKINDITLKSFFNLDSWLHLTDQEKIEIASNYQRTSTNLANRGKGFQDMKQVCEQVDGSIMMVHSRQGYWAKGYSKIARQLEKKSNYNTSVNGTIISWLIPLNDSSIRINDSAA